MSRLRELYDNEITKKMTEKFGYKNPMMVPKIAQEKLPINMRQNIRPLSKRFIRKIKGMDRA